MSSADEFADVEDHWEIYTTYVDEKPAVILVDFGVSKVAPVASMPQLVWLWIHLKSPDSEGFPSEDEDMSLNEIEDAVTDAFEDSKTRYVGRVTSDGRREFYFYTSDPVEFRRVTEESMKAFSGYMSEIDDADDPEWTHYWNVLYPGAEDFQQINNAHEIGRLQREGDSLTRPRPVDHFANFKTEENRTEFAIAAGALGYETVSQKENPEESEYPFNIGLLRTDPVDPETIDEITFELFELAEKHDGLYEGWTSPVVKGGKSK